MTEANLEELSQAKLGFEIVKFSDINRALNKIKKGEIEEIDDQIGILKLILECSRKQSIQWEKSNFYSFLGAFQLISSTVVAMPDYRIDIQRISKSFEELLIGTQFERTKKTVRDRISRLVEPSAHYTVASSGAQRGVRAFGVRN